MAELSDCVKRELLDIIREDKGRIVEGVEFWWAMSLIPRTIRILERRNDTADLAPKHPGIAFNVEREGKTYFVIPLLRNDGQSNYGFFEDKGPDQVDSITYRRRSGVVWRGYSKD